MCERAPPPLVNTKRGGTAPITSSLRVKDRPPPEWLLRAPLCRHGAAITPSVISGFIRTSSEPLRLTLMLTLTARHQLIPERDLRDQEVPDVGLLLHHAVRHDGG